MCLFIKCYELFSKIESSPLWRVVFLARRLPDLLHSTMQIADDAEVVIQDTARPGVGGAVVRGGSGGKEGEGGSDQVRNIDLTGLEPPILAQILQTHHSPG